MNTRRIPFQFSTTDPLARQRELEKRFGLHPTCPEMYVDVNNPFSMNTTPKETSSPRLQHRVPIFAEGYDQPIHSSSVDSMASVPDKKPNVRVIPIEVEGADSRSPRHRTYSGPADTLADRCDNLASERIDRFPFKRYNFEDSPKPLKPKLDAEPRVYNIPIQVEGANTIPRNTKPKFVPKFSIPTSKVDATPKPKDTSPNVNNGCQTSKLPSKLSSKKDDKVQSESNENKVEQPKNYVEIALKKIEDILTEFKTYETGVAEFTGTSKDKQFRYLDEMLTRCMLRLDDIDTMGNEEIRLSRKNAVKKVQASIDLLESKTNVQPVSSTEVPQVQSTTDENVAEKNDDVEMKDNQEMQDNAVTSTENVTSSEIKEMDLTPSDNTDQSKAADSISNSNVESKVESVEETSIEMSEIPQEKADDEMQDEENLTLHQQNSMPEEISLDKVNSTNDAQSSELCESDGKSTVPIEVLSKTPTNDVEMLDDSTSIEVNEPPLEESAENTDINKSSENEVEMVDVQEISSETSEKKECETVEKSVNHSSECSEQKELYQSDDVSLKNGPNTLDSVIHESDNKFISDLPEQDAKCASSQSEKDTTLNTDVK